MLLMSLIAVLSLGSSLQQSPALPGAPVSPVGVWRTMSDKNGEAQSEVRIYEEDGLLFGRVERLLLTEDVPETCERCKDERKGQPLVGLIFLHNMKASGDEYKGGEILDPETGKVYRCKMKLDKTGTRLTIRGYVGISLFGRSQTWHRVQ